MTDHMKILARMEREAAVEQIKSRRVDAQLREALIRERGEEYVDQLDARIEREWREFVEKNKGSV